MKSVFALASVIAGPLAVLVGNLIGLPFDPLFLGLAVNLAIMGIGFAVGNEQLEQQSVLADAASAQKKGA